MANRTEKAAAAAGEGFNLLSVIFTGLAFLLIAAGVITLLYEAYGFVTGNGWTVFKVGDLLDWLVGPPPPIGDMGTATKALALLSLLPLGLGLMVLGFGVSKLGDLFERLS